MAVVVLPIRAEWGDQGGDWCLSLYVDQDKKLIPCLQGHEGGDKLGNTHGKDTTRILKSENIRNETF